MLRFNIIDRRFLNIFKASSRFNQSILNHFVVGEKPELTVNHLVNCVKSGRIGNRINEEIDDVISQWLLLADLEHNSPNGKTFIDGVNHVPSIGRAYKYG